MGGDTIGGFAREGNAEFVSMIDRPSSYFLDSGDHF